MRFFVEKIITHSPLCARLQRNFYRKRPAGRPRRRKRVYFFISVPARSGKRPAGARPMDGVPRGLARGADTDRSKIFPETPGAGRVGSASVSHTGAAPYNDKPLFRQAVRGHIAMPYVSLIYERFHFWNRIPWSPTFFPTARKECRPRKGAPPRVSGLNFETPAYVRATRSLRSLKHGAAASRRRSQNFPLRGRPPTERAGKLHQCSPVILYEVRASFSTRTFRTHGCGPT